MGARRFPAALLLLGAVPASTCSAASPPAGDAPMRLGVATHFDQGWPIARLDQVGAIGATTIRDDLSWGKSEPATGRYDFERESARYIRAACDRHIDVLLMVAPENRGYDDGRSAYTPAAQAAYGRFLAAALDHFGDRCVRAIEVGNEINAGGLKLPDGVDPAAAYVSLLSAARQAVRVRHPGVAILGGSTNVIGTGFLDGIFRAGGLARMDGVVVHPYREHPDGVGVELARLHAAMRRAGASRPIWATEFGNQFDDPERAASFLLRMTAMLSAAGVERAYWYDLLDEPAYRNMGLFDDRLAPKPAGRAARLALRTLVSAGRAVRVDAGSPTTFIYRFGRDRFLFWGTPRPVRFGGGASFLDAQGRPIAAPARLSEEPFVATGPVRYQFGRDPVLADSLHQFGAPPWSYLARRPGGAAVPLAMIDWGWTSYYGAPQFRPMEIRSDAGIPAGDGGNPLAATVRYTAPANQVAALSACFGKKREGAGLLVTVLQAGRPIWTDVLAERRAIAGLPVSLRKGEALDVAFAPRGDAGGNGFSYRIRLSAPGGAGGLSCA